MHISPLWKTVVTLASIALLISGCAHRSPTNHNFSTSYSSSNSRLPLYHGQAPFSSSFNENKYAWRMPRHYETHGKNTILVNPASFAWGAYDRKGKLIRAGIASAGADFCADEGKPCRTDIGTFKISKMGDDSCISRTYPIGKGGSLMPYCMFFNKGQALHGAPDQMMREEHLSHGCIRLRIPDAEWIRYQFASVGTRVVILPY